MTDPLRLRIICRDIFRGEKKPGVPFLCLHFNGNLSAFVPASDIDKFDDICIGDVVSCDVYDFTVEGIKFIPRSFVSRSVYDSYYNQSNDASVCDSGDGSQSEG